MTTVLPTIVRPFERRWKAGTKEIDAVRCQRTPFQECGNSYLRAVDLAYPDPDLTDDVVLLRPWSPSDLQCVEEAGADPRIPAGTSVPAEFSAERGLAFIGRQRRRITDGEGISMTITDARTDRAAGLIWLPVRPQPGVFGLGYWVVPRAREASWGTRAVRLASTPAI